LLQATHTDINEWMDRNEKKGMQENYLMKSIS